MARQTFPNSAIFANSAPDIALPNVSVYATAYENGDGKTPPDAGVHNYVLNRSDQQHQHIEQNGIPRWDTRTSYALKGLCLSLAGVIMQSQTSGNVGNNPDTDTGANWLPYDASVIARIFPVGSVCFRSVNPGNSVGSGGLGFGTWTDLQGKVIIGSGSFTDSNGDAKTFVTGNTYGEYNHTLTEAEMPKHSHSLKYYSVDSGNGAFAATPLAFPTDFNTSEAGNDQAHNNIQPSFAVKMWYRSA